MLSLLALAALAFASPLPRAGYTFKESLPSAPNGWEQLSRAPGSHLLKLKIGLIQPRFGELEQALWEVSLPGSERYGMHLGKEEVEKLIRPHDESLELVDAWLVENGIPLSALSRSPAQDWITLTLPVSLAEELLDTEYHVFHHTTSGDYLVRTLGYSLPTHLHAHIDVVQPSTTFARLQPKRSSLHGDSIVLSSEAAIPPVPASCNHTITPACLKEIYNVGNYTASSTSGNILGIAGYLEQWANMNDTNWFYQVYLPQAAEQGYMFTVELINNGTNSQNESDAGGEANLDVQYAGGLSFPIPNIYYSTGGSPPYIPDDNTPQDTNEPYAEFLAYVLAKPDSELPRQLSTSYGDDEQSVPYSYAVRVCNEFAQLGARGVSVMFSSGDGGVGDGLGPNDQAYGPTTCYTNDGRNASSFLPAFPASCPYVTTVGGTYHEGPEWAVPFSGGGFSKYFSRPSYQSPTVDTYLAQHPQYLSLYQGLFNPSGRAYPDVSAQSNNFTLNRGGMWVLEAGTSASCPTFTGIVALVNDYLIAHGKPTLGFLNPWLYAVGHNAFNDITIGNNPGCLTNGFNATAGWDPVTGWGSPDFGKITSLLSLGS
ncbi:subtilisin-like protein [Dacryopinax primogenitus]|uniref:tripeptidyl-peptidase II n=1 Tax=Dacryopinax primogenitus (strain DJM 731) TaxID=1858805 RepID=M5FTS6_DACPD|nr:subtilisin-like protein [Dacryopinax primogenitus]EJT99523.1 subtilisin-like protein [Dacryopinax primogenitus]